MIEESQTPKTTIIRTKVTNGVAEALMINEDNNCILRTANRSHSLRNPYQASAFGLTAMINFKCDWNPNGDILFMDDAQTATLIYKDGAKKHIQALNVETTIIDILWLERIEAFLILYYNGQIRLIPKNSRVIITAEAFQSSTGNYLICDCGDHFCVVTKRRLVQGPFKYEETAVAIFDRKACMVHDEHIQSVDQSIQNIAYDRTTDELYLVSNKEAQIIRMNGFSSVKKKFNFSFHNTAFGIAANASFLYFAQQDQGLCTINMHTGKIMCIFPSHRTITGFYPSLDEVVVVENNQKI